MNELQIVYTLISRGVLSGSTLFVQGFFVSTFMDIFVYIFVTASASGYWRLWSDCIVAPALYVNKAMWNVYF